MALKEGTVRWRMTRDARFWNLTYTKLHKIDRYHGQPTGMFSADEHFGGRHPSRGVELCVIVEMMHSLAVLHQVQADVAFLDRLDCGRGHGGGRRHDGR